jgi:DDE_Tnp_1-associated
MSLTETFVGLGDPRRKQGLRVEQSQVLTMVVIAYVCGYFSYRKIATFAASHRDFFTEALALRHGVPSFVTFRDILIHINEAELIAAFNTWAKDFVAITPEEWVSGDGKSLGSTVVEASHSSQDFQSVVSFFVQRTGMVALLEMYRNKKVSEIAIVQGMFTALQDKHLHFVLDALHCQKKR